MAPGIDGLPAAELEIPVSEPVARFLATLNPRTLSRLRLAIRAFEWLPFPWRFSRLDLPAREQYLVNLERSRLGLHRDLLLLAKVLSTLGYASNPEVIRTVGCPPSCEMAGGTIPPDSGGLGDLEAPAGTEECDVVIVGSGAGGAAAAAALAESGLDVIVLEAGEHYNRDNYPVEPLDAISALYRDGGLTVASGRPMIPVPVGRAIGGTTVINSGTCFRAPEHVLTDWRDNGGVDWAHDLDSEFSEAEEFLRVTQVDPETMGRNGQLAMEGAALIGASGAPISRNAGRCVGCSSCPLGCKIDAKQGMHVSYLPRAVAAGARIRSGVDVRRLIIKGDRVIGVRADIAPGPDAAHDRTREYRVLARRVIVSAGALGTPELLIRSGLGGGQVGRNLHVHPASWIGARYEEPVRGWDGVMQSYYIDQWEDRSVLLEATFTPLAFGGAWIPGAGRAHQQGMLEFDRIGSIGVHLLDRSSGRVGLRNDGCLKASYRLTRDDADRIAFGIARAAEIHFAAGATEVYPNIGGVAPLRPRDLARFESSRFSPNHLRLEAFHPMGTARIGRSAADSVCTPDGAVRGTENLYVADTSLFPSSVGVNPMMTAIAFSKRVATGIAADLTG